MNRFVIADAKKCIGCRTCEIACVMAHRPRDEKSALTAENFNPRLTVIKSRQISTPILCRQCDDAPCLKVCPNGAITQTQNSIQVLQEKCIGCKTCVVACPFGAITVVVKTGYATNGEIHAEAQKCDLCIDQQAGPACIKVCPTHALYLVNEKTLDELVRKKQQRTALEASLIDY